MILVYEYMPNGTLGDHLHRITSNGSNSPLSWDQRLNICIDAARGLDYLHTGTSIRQRVIHRDVKSSNILLDENFAAKISDFGLSRIGPSSLVGTTHVYTSVIRGTFGYIDEEYFLTRRLTRKSDVYAFGVVLFEAVSGNPAVSLMLDEEQRSLAGWGRHCIREGTVINQLMEPCLRGKVLSACLEAFVDIAYKCILKCPKDRPTMAEVVARLEHAFELQKGIDPPAVQGNMPSTTNTYNSSAVTELSSEVQEVISHSYAHRYPSTQQEVIDANNTHLYHKELIDSYRPSASASGMQRFIRRSKKKRIVRKVWSLFSAKATSNSVADDGRSSESLVFNRGTRGGESIEALQLELDTHEGESIEALQLELDIIRVATQNFSEANKIRECAISSMYKIM